MVFFKKIHEKLSNELLHVMCLLCYQYLIRDIGYDFCPKCTKLYVIFSILNWFQCDICEQTRFQNSAAKLFHHNNYKLCNFFVKDYRLCPLCKKKNVRISYKITGKRPKF